VILREATMQQLHDDLSDDFSDALEAPAVLFDRCPTFAAAADEPSICATCGWLLDDHVDLDHHQPVAA
jgi:hypothetical protein